MYVKAIFAFAVMIATFQPSCAANLIVQGTQDITPVESVLYNFGQRSGKVIACSRGALTHADRWSLGHEGGQVRVPPSPSMSPTPSG
jgi:hypothetical protein